VKAKKKILVVDDEKDYAEMVKINLERTNLFFVEIVSKARDATAAIIKFKPDLIILDVIMRDISGTTLAKQLRDDPELKHIPICFLTVSVKSVSSFSEREKIAYLQKPVTTDDLVRAIQKNLGD